MQKREILLIFAEKKDGKGNISLSVVLHNDSDYKDWLVELKERFYSHRLKASCATNGYLLDFYWKLGRDIEAKQYTNNYGSGFYKNLSQDLKNEMPGVKGFSPSNLKYMSYFYKLYAPLLANRQQPADDFTESLISSDIQTIAEQKQNRQQPVDDFKLLFFIPWGHHCRILEKCKDNMPKALFFVRKTWENNWGTWRSSQLAWYRPLWAWRQSHHKLPIHASCCAEWLSATDNKRPLSVGFP